MNTFLQTFYLSINNRKNQVVNRKHQYIFHGLKFHHKMNIRKIVFSCVTSIRNYCSSRVLPIRFVLFSRFTNKAIVTQQTVYQLLLQTKHKSLVVMCAIKVYNRHARLCLNHNNINLVGDRGIVISYKGNFLQGSYIIYFSIICRYSQTYCCAEY